MTDREEPLVGGAQASGLVRIGDTVRRPAYARSHFVDELLRHLEAVGFDGAPRALGYDEHSRQVLTYVEGEVPHGLPYNLSDARIRSGAELVRAYHDATASSPLRGIEEVVCHGDLGPHNTVFRGDRAVAIIDWDDDVGPGSRAVDFAHAVWCFADLCDVEVAVGEQARRTRLMCDAYPGMSPDIVVQELGARFRRARAEHAAARRRGAVEVFDGLIEWLGVNGWALRRPAV